MASSESSSGVDLKIGFDRFRRQLILIVAGALGTISIVANVVSALAGPAMPMTAPRFPALLALPCALAFGHAWYGKLNVAPRLLCLGGTVAMGLVFLLSGWSVTAMGLTGLLLLLLLSGFLSGPRATAMLGAVDALLVIGLALVAFVRGQPVVLGDVFGCLVVTALFAVTISLFTRKTDAIRESLRARLLEVEAVVSHLYATGGQIALDARQIHVMADQQSEGASQQGVALSATRAEMLSILEASRAIAAAAREVHASAERTTTNNERVAALVDALSGRALRVERIADGIKQIAGTSELLALNAALEGVKAGEAGDGFLIVAAKMQRLSESTASLSREIKALTAEIREAGDQTRRSAEEAVALAQGTTDSGRKITVVTAQQQQGTEQVARALDEIAGVIERMAAGAELTQRATHSLLEVAERLPKILEELGSGARRQAMRNQPPSSGEPAQPPR